MCHGGAKEGARTGGGEDLSANMRYRRVQRHQSLNVWNRPSVFNTSESRSEMRLSATGRR